jgi:hypothetical protein
MTISHDPAHATFQPLKPVAAMHITTRAENTNGSDKDVVNAASLVNFRTVLRVFQV